MRLVAALQGDLKKIMAEELKAGEQAVTNGVREVTDGLKLELRGQVTSARLGQRLANTWRGQVYPKGQPSINAAGFVWNKAPKIIGAYAKGAVVRSHRGVFLAIPTPEAGKFAAFRKITPALWERIHGKKLRFVARRGVPSLLVADDMRARRGKRGGFANASATAMRTGRGLTTVTMFILVPQVTIRKRFDVDSVAQKWIAALPQLVARNWEKDAER